LHNNAQYLHKPLVIRRYLSFESTYFRCIIPQTMARPPRITRHHLAPLLMGAREPLSAAEMAARLRVNQTTIIRTLPDFGADLITLGKGRSTRYLLRREVQHAGNRWPIHRVDEAGRAQTWGWIEAAYERRWRITWTGSAPEWERHFLEGEGLWQGFPFFLSDLRPQGFLGRAIARAVSRTLALPEDWRSWSDDHTLIYLQAAGEDLPGSLVVGDTCLRRALARMAHPLPAEFVPEGERAAHFPQLAAASMESLPDSSAGGEQPKFLTTISGAEGTRQPVLVKFSPPVDQRAGQRWADLLLCEWHAHQVLAEQGLALPGSRTLDAGGRRFLEVPRFDRTSAGGRIGTVSLFALHAAASGFDSGPWTNAIDALHQSRLVTTETASTARQLHAFGELIGNTDMHFGNVSFFLTASLPLPLTPAYDMLPMLWAPGPYGEISPRRFAPPPPVPSDQSAWQTARGWAHTFWDRVAADDRLSPDFAAIVESARRTIAALG
jgi:hypothetical protein